MLPSSLTQPYGCLRRLILEVGSWRWRAGEIGTLYPRSVFLEIPSFCCSFCSLRKALGKLQSLLSECCKSLDCLRGWKRFDAGCLLQLFWLTLLGMPLAAGTVVGGLLAHGHSQRYVGVRPLWEASSSRTKAKEHAWHVLPCVACLLQPLLAGRCCTSELLAGICNLKDGPV